MSNNTNLVSLADRPEEERKAIARKGIEASIAAKREKKTFKKLLDVAFEGEVENAKTGEKRTRKEVAVAQLVNQAMAGDLKAIDLSATLMGEKVTVVKASVEAEVSLRQRTAADACNYLYNDFSPTYQQFFLRTADARHVLLQGGRRSGKTQATIRHLVKMAAAMHSEVEVMVVCYQYPQLSKTIDDFQLATGVPVHADKARTEGALWRFCNFDDFTKAQGSQCDFLFINEAVNLPEDIADVLVLGTRLQCFYNYNPTKRSWLSKLVAPDASNLLCTTFKDNNYLPAEQVAEFEAMRERAQLPTASMHDRYMYEVYYLGNFATMVGQVFQHIERCTREEYQKLPASEFYGLDFGFATDGDPTVLVGVKVANNRIYIRTYIYERGLVSDEVLTTRMQRAGLNQYCDIRADYGGAGKGRIINLRRLGWSVAPCYKTTRLDGLAQMLCYDAVVICEGDDITAAEFEGLELDEAQRTRGNDHAIDATRYAFILAKNSTL